MLDRIITPIPVPGTCKYVISLDKRDFADVIKIQGFQGWGIILDYLGGSNVIIRLLVSERGRQSQRKFEDKCRH